MNVRTIEALRLLAREHACVYDLLALVETLETKGRRERTEVDRRHLVEATSALAFARMDNDVVRHARGIAALEQLAPADSLDLRQS